MTCRSTRDTAFLGGVTAAATHEIRNILAIVKESAGLVEDCCQRDEDGVDLDRIRRALGRIQRQVTRGTDLMVSLSRVAHAGEESLAEIDLGAELEHTVLLCQRIGRRKSQQVHLQPPGATITVRTDPLLLQELLFAAVQRCLADRVPGAVLRVSLLRVEGRPAVALTSDDAPDADAGLTPQTPSLEELAAEIGVQLRKTDARGDLLLLLSAPG